MFGQDSFVYGNLTDPSGNPVPYSSIVIIDNDSVLVGYCVADLQGGYKIKLSHSGTYKIKASCLGYATHQEQINVLPNGSSCINIVLKQTVTQIKDVIVQGGVQGIEQKEDTLKYNAKIFSDGTEKVLGDVLEKLPGVNVDVGGNITVQGERIDKVMLNGKDLFANNTQLAVNNLSADIAKDIEVIRNYNDLNLLKEIHAEDKTVINIKTDSSRIGRLSGTMSGGGGFTNKYNLKTSAIHLKPNFMTSGIVATNNTGSPVFSILDFIALQGGMDDLIEKNGSSSVTELSEAETSLLIDRNNTYDQRNTLSTLSLSFQPSSRLNINSYLLWNNKLDKNEDFNTYEYYQNPELSSLQFVSGESKSNLWNANLKLRFNLSDKTTLQTKAILSYFNTEQLLNYIDVAHIDTIETRNKHNNYATNFKQTASLLKKVNYGLLTSDFFVENQQSDQHIRIQTDSLILPFEGVLYDGIKQIKQLKKTDKLNVGGNIAQHFKIDQQHILHTTFYSQINRQKLFSNLQDSTTNNNKLTVLTSGLGAGIQKNVGFIRYNLRLQYQYSWLTHTLNLAKYKFGALNPDLALSLNFTKSHILKLGFSKTDKPLAIDYFNTGVLIENYQNYRVKGNLANAIKSQYSLDLSYQINSLFSNTFFYVLGNYSFYKNDKSVNYIQDNLLMVEENILTQDNTDYYITTSLSQGLLHSRWKFKLLGEISGSNFYIQSNSYDQLNHTINYKGAATFRSDFKQGLNIELFSKQDYLKIRVSDNSLTYQYSATYRLGLKYVQKQYNLAISLANRNVQTTYSLKKYINLSFSMNYSLNKHIELGLTGENILHLNELSWISNIDNGIYKQLKYYKQVPGNILINLRYRF